MRPADLPGRSDAVGRLFEVTLTTADYWNDPAALSHTAGRAYAGETTAFENRFLRKRQPIHLVELRRIG